MAELEKTIYVYMSEGGSAPLLMGRLFSAVIRGNETFSFEYDKAWLESGSLPFALDPELALFSGRHYDSSAKPLFGIFTDSCPDRWGRTLMRRREIITAKNENRRPKRLTESDYLLGVFDDTRMGALRFSLGENLPFLSYDADISAPPWTTLRALENASRQFELGDASNETKWFSQLIAPGSSLGGARPKASITAPDGSLWIAKFPSKNDEINVGAWEMVAHDLAALCGLSVSKARLETFSALGSTYLVKRFDRNGGRRIHFASAMTLLNKTDGADADETSYLDLASFIRSNGAAPERDLTELWKRIVFSIAISNTDDHLRNHGFLLDKRGWVLSPMFDVNPSYGDCLSLNIDQSSNLMDFELALETSKYYGIGLDEARAVIGEMTRIIDKKRNAIARSYGLSQDEISSMESAFNLNF
ncbi:MAG: type II toxin-antitoxin system HipA family toxin [Clostridia bacterium]|nr:type II toxin-antitoxin system HipA family toxin [Clostridia bacterium]